MEEKDVVIEEIMQELNWRERMVVKLHKELLKKTYKNPHKDKPNGAD